LAKSRTISSTQAVYTIWNESSFIYVGMSYAHRNDLDNAKTKGVSGRRASHASGRRSGDQFCIYICDRYVVPHLNVADMEALANGARILDARTRDFIRDELSYRAVITASGAEARALELLIRRDDLPGAGRPQINP